LPIVWYGYEILLVILREKYVVYAECVGEHGVDGGVLGLRGRK
jgi:hypothetical protein